MKEENSGRNKQTKTAKVLGLFMAAVLAAGSGGCTSSGHKHIDINRDGYCDEDGQPTSSGSGSRYFGSHYFGGYGSSNPATTDVNGKSSSSGISSATSPKGGIGSHSTGSAGG